MSVPDPQQALQALLTPSTLKTTLFPPTSRYAGLDLATLERPEGTPVVYVRRRFIPPPERYVTLQEHVVAQGQRLDQLAALYLGDPEQFWRICDANVVLRPEELEVVGRVVRITLPEGIPGATNMQG